MLKPTKHATTNFRMLAPYLDNVDRNDGHTKFLADGYMPLSIEKLYYYHDGNPVYGMMHYTTQNGDLMRDPDMTFSVNREAGTVEPLTFQNDFMGLYQEVYLDDGKRYRPWLRTSLDDFLWHWLQNIQEHGFDPNQAPDAPAPEDAQPEERDDWEDIDPEEVKRRLHDNPEDSPFVRQVMDDVERMAAEEEAPAAPDGQVLFPLD